MIRRGKHDGWLQSTHSSFMSWAFLNGAQFNGIEVKAIDGKGLGMIASDSKPRVSSDPLIVVPQDLILSKENIHQHAKANIRLKEILEALGDFGITTRGAVLTFLLLQATYCCPEVNDRKGLPSTFAEYVKLLPMELLPTFWTEEELQECIGTSLKAATDAKLKSLSREYEMFFAATIEIPWCSQYWWNEEKGTVTFDDWKHVDAFYRSRALEFPGIGDCMAPCIDIANHASGEQTVARYESDQDGNGLLLPYDTKQVRPGEEITITYGDEKGACEMIFSYGFLEDDMSSARDLYLDLDIPEDDPLKRAKQVTSGCPPGVRLIDGVNGLRWESEYVWYICVNEEDGLFFEIVNTVNGDQEIQAYFRNIELNDAGTLPSLLESDPLWDVYQLRAVVTIEQRVEQQISILSESRRALDSGRISHTVRETPLKWANKLRILEKDLLNRFLEHLDTVKIRLSNSSVVQTYLETTSAANEHEDEFS